MCCSPRSLSISCLTLAHPIILEPYLSHELPDLITYLLWSISCNKSYRLLSILYVPDTVLSVSPTLPCLILTTLKYVLLSSSCR